MLGNLWQYGGMVELTHYIGLYFVKSRDAQVGLGIRDVYANSSIGLVKTQWSIL